MKCLKRNQQKFYYSLFVDKEPIVDDYGNESGEYRIIYTEPTELKGNISAARGENEFTVFGVNAQYDKVIVLDDVNCPIDDTSILFIGIAPKKTDGNYNNNYIVKRVAKSLNSISIAISKVGSQ